jgi:hypothetical protein
LVASTKSGCDRLEIGSTKNLPGLIPKNGPISLVAAEIHLGRWPTGICDGWLRCNIQVACHTAENKISSYVRTLWGKHGNPEAGFIAGFRQSAQKLAY